MIINVYWSSFKVPVNLNRFSSNLNYLNRFSKNTHISNFTKIRPVGADMFHVDRRMERQTGRHDEVNSYFPQFCESA